MYLITCRNANAFIANTNFSMAVCNFCINNNICIFRRKLNGIRNQEITSNSTYNYSYYPIVLDNQEIMLSVINALNKKDIFPRRYFFPSLDTLNYVDGVNCPVSRNLSSRIICLPLYYDLQENEAESIAKTINEIVKAN